MSNPVSNLGLSDKTAGGGMPLDCETELDAIYRTEFPWLVRFFRRRLNSAEDAQDLAHETMLRFMRVAPSRELAIPQAYLHRIATNLARDYAASGAQRLALRTVPLIEGLDVEVGVDQHQIIASRDELAAWEAILSKLKPRTLEIFLLSRVDGFTYNEVAAKLGMTIWNVKKHMRKAIQHVERYRMAR